MAWMSGAAPLKSHGGHEEVPSEDMKLRKRCTPFLDEPETCMFSLPVLTLLQKGSL